MNVKLDLNERERRRFATMLQSIGMTASEAATAVAAGKDEDFGTALTVLSIQVMGLRELQEILIAALRHGACPPPRIFRRLSTVSNAARKGGVS